MGVAAAIERIRLHLAADKKKKKKRTPPKDPSRFVASRTLNATPAALGALRAAAGKLPRTRQPIPADAMKGSKYGTMVAQGWGGPRVGKGFYACDNDLLPLARAVCGVVPVAMLGEMFGPDFARCFQDASFLEMEARPACFLTTNFSHAGDLTAGALELLHRDSNDISSTILVLWQDPATPEEHRAYWFEEGFDAPVPLAGG